MLKLNNLYLFFFRTSQVTLEGMFSSEEFGADSEMDRADNACQPKINPEKVITLSIVAIEGMIEEHDNP